MMDLTYFNKIVANLQEINEKQSENIKKAAELIKNTSLSISEIAQKVGFSSFSYFGSTYFIVLPPLCFLSEYKS